MCCGWIIFFQVPPFQKSHCNMYSIKFPAGNSYIISSSAVMAKKCTIVHCAMCIVIA